MSKVGIPAASIVTDVFESTGHAMAQSWGLPDYKFLSLPHPIANLTEAQLDQRAREIAPEIVKLLLDRGAPLTIPGTGDGSSLALFRRAVNIETPFSTTSSGL